MYKLRFTVSKSYLLFQTLPLYGIFLSVSFPRNSVGNDGSGGSFFLSGILQGFV